VTFLSAAQVASGSFGRGRLQVWDCEARRRRWRWQALRIESSLAEPSLTSIEAAAYRHKQISILYWATRWRIVQRGGQAR